MIKTNKTRIKTTFENIKNRINYLLMNFQIKFKIFVEKQKKILNDPKTFYLILKNVTRHFCYNTGLHGYRFIALIRLTVIERFVWTFIVLSFLLTALSLIYLSLNYENLKGATVTMTDSTYYPIYLYSFPAISICSFNKISKKKALELADKLADDIKDIPSIYKDLVYLTNLYFPRYNQKDDIIYKKLEEILACQNLTVDIALKEIAPSCSDLLSICKLKGRITRCDSLFQDTITPEGLCCTFNHFALKNKKFTGYNAERYKYIPKKLVSCGTDMGINLVLNVNQDDYYASELAAVGSKILIHHPYNYPEWNSRSIMISPATITSISVIPYKTYTTHEVLHLNAKDRGCIFSFERQLRIFTNYTHQNCLNECRINLILKLCECIPFYYLNEDVEAYSNDRICNLSDTSCLSKYKATYLSSIPGYSEESIKDPNKHPWGDEYNSCDCPPSCENLEYMTSETKTNLVLNKMRSIILNGNVSMVNIFYKNLFGTINKTDVYKRWHALLGLLGGLLGLCIGFSMTGAFDIPYYYVFRLLFDIHTGIKIHPGQNPKDQYKKTAIKLNLFNTNKKKMTDGKEPIKNVSSIYNSIKPTRTHFNLPELHLFKSKKNEYYPYLE